MSHVKPSVCPSPVSPCLRLTVDSSESRMSSPQHAVRNEPCRPPRMGPAPRGRYATSTRSRFLRPGLEPRNGRSRNSWNGTSSNIIAGLFLCRLRILRIFLRPRADLDTTRLQGDTWPARARNLFICVGEKPHRGLSDPQLPEGFAGSGKVRKLHFRVFPRQDHTRCSSGEGGFHGSPDVRRLSFLFVLARGDVDVNTRIDLNPVADTCQRALRLACHVIRGKPGGRKLFQMGLPFVTQNAVVKIGNLFGRCVAKRVEWTLRMY